MLWTTADGVRERGLPEPDGETDMTSGITRNDQASQVQCAHPRAELSESLRPSLFWPAMTPASSPALTCRWTAA
jgi:hypothetical protein